MFETGSPLLSKVERATRIGAAYREDSIGMVGIACIPSTVAFTHGFSDEEFKNGLHANSFTAEVLEASKKLAKKYGERVTQKSFLIGNTVKRVHDEIRDVLAKSRATWLIYIGENKQGHIMGALKEDKDKYLLWDSANLPKVKDVTSLDLAEIISMRHKELNLFVYILGFSK